FGATLLAGLAALAGLCLLTRVSTALGLYVALGLLLPVVAWRGLRSGEGALQVVARMLPAAAILGFFIVIAGIVNYGRWGNPLAFTDPTHYLWWLAHDNERMLRYEHYGLFSIARLGYGLMYYFFPVWAVPTGDGSLYWGAYQHRVIDSV